MNITLSLDDKLVKEVRKIAVERDTTLTGLVRAHLEEIAAAYAKSGRKRRELEALNRSFERVQFSLGKKTWRREDLYDRPALARWGKDGQDKDAQDKDGRGE